VADALQVRHRDAAGSYRRPDGSPAGSPFYSLQLVNLSLTFQELGRRQSSEAGELPKVLRGLLEYKFDGEAVGGKPYSRS
jgi:hypothetical protein